MCRKKTNKTHSGKWGYSVPKKCPVLRQTWVQELQATIQITENIKGILTGPAE